MYQQGGSFYGDEEFLIFTFSKLSKGVILVFVTQHWYGDPCFHFLHSGVEKSLRMGEVSETSPKATCQKFQQEEVEVEKLEVGGKAAQTNTEVANLPSL